MYIKYKGKFKEDLNDYIQEQPWMFELDGNGQSFWELPVCMQWGVVYSFMENTDYLMLLHKQSLELKDCWKQSIIDAQKWYNENK